MILAKDLSIVTEITRVLLRRHLKFPTACMRGFRDEGRILAVASNVRGEIRRWSRLYSLVLVRSHVLNGHFSPSVLNTAPICSDVAFLSREGAFEFFAASFAPQKDNRSVTITLQHEDQTCDTVAVDKRARSRPNTLPRELPN